MECCCQIIIGRFCCRKKHLVNFQLSKEKLAISHSNEDVKGPSSCSIRSKLTEENIDSKTIYSLVSVKINDYTNCYQDQNYLSAESGLLKPAKSACNSYMTQFSKTSASVIK